MNLLRSVPSCQRRGPLSGRELLARPQLKRFDLMLLLGQSSHSYKDFDLMNPYNNHKEFCRRPSSHSVAAAGSQPTGLAARTSGEAVFGPVSREAGILPHSQQCSEAMGNSWRSLANCHDDCFRSISCSNSRRVNSSLSKVA